METDEKMRQLFWARIAEMLLNGVSLFDTVDAIISDMTEDIYHDLYFEKDIKEISHPYKRDYGHYFLDKI